MKLTINFYDKLNDTCSETFMNGCDIEGARNIKKDFGFNILPNLFRKAHLIAEALSEGDYNRADMYEVIYRVDGTRCTEDDLISFIKNDKFDNFKDYLTELHRDFEL